MAKPACAYELPDYALRVLDVIESAGYEAWVVGGWVRDAVRGAAPHDVDVCCDARWEEVDRLFRSAGFEVHRTGVEHGTVTVLLGKVGYEVTTYRIDGKYEDSRHPSEVTFTRNL